VPYESCRSLENSRHELKRRDRLTASKSSAMDHGELSSAQLASVVNSLSDPISVHNQSGEIVWANKELCELYSKSLSDLTGLTCEQALNTGHPGADASLGGRVWSVEILPLSEKGVKVGFVRVMRDVTAERHAYGLLVNAERFASLGQMLFGIAHDVGTPLNIISGYAEFLLMRMEPDERGYKELSAIMEQTKRIAVMLNEALDLARPAKRQPSAVDPKTLLSESLDLGAHFYRRFNVRTQLTCAISPPLIYGEAPRLRQAFFSLLLNAGQKVGAGGHVEVVIVESPDMRDSISVRVLGTDATGQGHDFARSLGKLAGKGQLGTFGLGLSLAREILEEAGAAIAFEASGERGIAILVQLPVTASS